MEEYSSQNINIDNFIYNIFSQPYLEPNHFYIDVDVNILQTILIKSMYYLWNIQDIKNITLDQFDIIQKYFNSFGFKINYTADIKNEELIAYNINFIPF